MITISLCMIVKNEEEVIGRCLDSVKGLVEEIVIVDTGSTDNTKQIISNYTDKIFDFKWIEDFSAARNYSFQKATKEYILWLDADDVVTGEDQENLLKLKKMLDQSVDAVSMDYGAGLDSYGKVQFSYKRFRLVKKEREFKWHGVVHEFLDVSGNLLHTDILIMHLPIKRDEKRNIRIYEKRLAQGEKFTPRDLYYYANELFEHKKFGEAITKYTEFLKMDEGWIEDKIRSCCKLSDCFTVLKKPNRILSWLLEALKYGIPRPDVCCRLGHWFLAHDQLETAIFWYKNALLNKVDLSLSLRNHDLETWVPHLQLCVCNEKLGNFEEAFKHNEMALKYCPHDPRILHNKRFLEEKLYVKLK